MSFQFSIIAIMDSKKTQSNNALPQLWVLHNMPRSGGTLVSKCLGSMETNIILSEIHPNAQHALSFNVLKQAQQWYGFLPNLDWQKTEFVDAITQIYNVVRQNDKQLILRDWSHADYLGPPVTNQPKEKPALLNVLSPYFDIRSIQLVRHPLDTWLSLRRLNLIKNNGINFQQFLKAYRCYLDNTKSDYCLVYEEFLRSPSQQLKTACQKVGLVYDQNYKNKWFSFDKITGDTSNSSSLREKPLIEFRPRRQCTDIDLQWLESQVDYKYLIGEIYG